MEMAAGAGAPNSKRFRCKISDRLRGKLVFRVGPEEHKTHSQCDCQNSHGNSVLFPHFLRAPLLVYTLK